MFTRSFTARLDYWIWARITGLAGCLTGLMFRTNIQERSGNGIRRLLTRT